jgi:hypothetical protein
MITIAVQRDSQKTQTNHNMHCMVVLWVRKGFMSVVEKVSSDLYRFASLRLTIGQGFPQVKDYFFKASSFEETFVTWAQEHAHVIDLSTTENKLECGVLLVLDCVRLFCVVFHAFPCFLSNEQVYTVTQGVPGVFREEFGRSAEVAAVFCGLHFVAFPYACL